MSLQQIKSGLGDNGILTVKAILNILVGETVTFFNVGKSMAPDQIIQTVELILEEYPYFKPEDFKLCFNRAKKGFYGQLYDRLDGMVLLKWLGEYDNERARDIEAIQARRNKELKDASTTLIGKPAQDNEVFTRNINQLLERMQKNKVEKIKVETNNSKPVFGEAYVKSQHWLAQFDKLHAKKPIGKSGRFIKRYGRILDISSFLEHKHWQYLEFVINQKSLYEVRKKSL